MAHFAKVVDGVVTDIIVAEQDVIDTGAFGDGWVQTSYNTHGGQHPEGRPLRKNFAVLGGFYDATADAFYAPAPFSTWVLNRDTFLWEPPTPKPDDGNYYEWNEVQQAWIMVDVAAIIPSFPTENETGS